MRDWARTRRRPLDVRFGRRYLPLGLRHVQAAGLLRRMQSTDQRQRLPPILRSTFRQTQLLGRKQLRDVGVGHRRH